MAAGWNPVFVNGMLESIFSAAAFTPPAASYIQLHTGDPGSGGSSNISSVSTRVALTWSAASGGSKSITASTTITASWAGTSPETLTHVSYWSAVTGGTFVVSDQLLAPVTVVTGQPVTLPSLTAPWTPLAA
jgi:alkylhydroperoxidase family enzyme